MIDPTFALYAWFPFAYFFLKRKLPVWGLPKSTLVLVLLGVLLLPANFIVKPPGLPESTKDIVQVVAPYVAILLGARGIWRARAERSGIRYHILLISLGMIGTVLTNGDEVVQGIVHIKSQSTADFRVFILWMLGTLWLPFTIGQRLVQTPDELRLLLRLVVVSLIWCWLPLLFEIRISPQLHFWIYGYFAFDFLQAMREGGFRPALLFPHGLNMAMFQFAGLVFAVGLHRAKIKTLGLSGLTIYFIGLGILFLCSSKGALVYSLVAPALLMFAGPRVQMAACWSLVLLTVAYPYLRYSEIIPVEDILDWATEQFGAKRTQSLQFRFDNEWVLLERAMKRPIFGWGLGGRNLLYKPWDGLQLTIPDGGWIIWLGQVGAVGFVGYFATYAVPLWAWMKNYRRIDPRDAPLISALALVLSVYAFDQVPNSLQDRMPIIYCGAMYSLCRFLPRYRERERQAQLAAAQPPPAQPASRQLPPRVAVY